MNGVKSADSPTQTRARQPRRAGRARGAAAGADDLIRAEALCRALGYEPRLGPNAAHRYGYFAGTDEQRLADLNGALRDPDVDAIWCIRGGYGATRILDQVDFDALARRPRALIGYSDITAVLNAALHHAGVVTFHGPDGPGGDAAVLRWHFERVLASPEPAGRLGRLPTPPDVLLPKENRIMALRGRRCRGLPAGRESLPLQCLVGTPHLPDFDGAILFPRRRRARTSTGLTGCWRTSGWWALSGGWPGSPSVGSPSSSDR